MQAKDCAIRFQVQDGVWEVGSVDRKRGIVPENDTYTSNQRGPSKCSFDLKRDPGTIWPDLKAFTPVEVDIGGVRRWAGRIKGTPTRDDDGGVINVQCEGWQYHLDDDDYAPFYIHEKLDGFKDMRSTPGAALGASALFAAGQFSQDQGLYLAHPNGTAVLAGCAVSCILDLGPNAQFRRVVIEWDASNNASSYDFRAYGSDQPTNAYPTGSFDLLLSIANNSGASGTSSASTTTGRRYLHLFLLNTIFNGTLASDIWWRIKACRTFAQTAYESGGQSVLKLPVIVNDALSKGTIFLSSDRSQIDAAGAAQFNITDFDPDGNKSPGEVIDGGLVFENMTFKVDEYKVPILKAKTTAPQVEIGNWRGSTFEDASSNSTEDIYNRVIIEGTTFDGQPVSVARTAGSLSGSSSSTPSVVVANPSADTNTTGWTSLLGTLSRDTTIFDSSLASIKITNTGQANVQGDMTGMFTKGTTYTLNFKARVPAGDTSTIIVLKFGDPTTGDQASTVVFVNAALLAGFVAQTIAWTPNADTTNGKIQALIWSPYGSTVTLNLDTFTLSQSGATAVDRGGFRRTKILQVKAALTDLIGARIGDLWLPDHRSTPLKGDITVVGDGAAREITTGIDAAPEALLQKTDELIRLSHRTDPDTGGHARDARIVEVTYTRATDSSLVTLDDTKQTFDKLLERLAVVTGRG